MKVCHKEPSSGDHHCSHKISWQSIYIVTMCHHGPKHQSKRLMPQYVYFSQSKVSKKWCFSTGRKKPGYCIGNTTQYYTVAVNMIQKVSGATSKTTHKAPKFTASNLYNSKPPTFSLNFPQVVINHGEHERGQKGWQSGMERGKVR